MQKVDQDYPIWHPFSQMKSTPELPVIKKAEGVWLYTEDGRKIFDAISSWWVTSHGHSHPHIAKCVYEQMQTLEHVIFAGFTHDPAVTLCKRIEKYLPKGDWKFFFSDNGSTAIEVALKMAIQYLRIEDMKRPVTVVSLDGSYHGDTFGAMAAAEKSVFTEPWDDLFFKTIQIPAPIPGHEQMCFDLLEKHANETIIFIYEPLIQGAGGMKMYSAEALDKLMEIVQEAGGICIADEVMTGFGRTGTWFASNQTKRKPEMLCLSKGLTGGALPMSLTVCDQKFYEAFLDDSFVKGFLHGHSFTGNPIGCAAALANMDLMEDQYTFDQIEAIEKVYHSFEERFSNHPLVRNVRIKGTIFAFDVYEDNAGYEHPLRNRLYEAFYEANLLLRPLGNVVYFLPPYVTDIDLLERSMRRVLEILDEL